jgi:putative sigma-54 modulation protein
MRIDVTFRQFAASKALRSYAEQKVGRVTKFLHAPLSAQVTLSLDGFRNIAEVSVQARGTTLTAREISHADMYAAIDIMVDKLSTQARRHKEKSGSHRAPPSPLPASPLDGNDCEPSTV